MSEKGAIMEKQTDNEKKVEELKEQMDDENFELSSTLMHLKTL